MPTGASPLNEANLNSKINIQTSTFTSTPTSSTSPRHDMSRRPSVPPIQTSNLNLAFPNVPGTTGTVGKPPPPPPKSPLRAARSGSAMSRRRGDGRVITLTMPSPLSALEPSTPPVAEAVPINTGGRRSGRRDFQPPPTSPISPGASLRAMRRQTQELRERAQKHQARYHARPVSPLQLQSLKRGNAARLSRRESSFSKLSRRLSLSRRSSSITNLRNSFRKNLEKGGVESGDSPSDGPDAGAGKRQSFVKRAQRESVKLKSILKKTSLQLVPTQNQVQFETPAETRIPQAHVQNQTQAPQAQDPASPSTRVESTASIGTTASKGSGYALVAQKKLGTTGRPPRRDTEKRRSKLQSILIPSSLRVGSRPSSVLNMGAGPGKRTSAHRKKPLAAGEECPMKPSLTIPVEKTERNRSWRASLLRSSVDGREKTRPEDKSDEPMVEIAPDAAPSTTPGSVPGSATEIAIEMSTETRATPLSTKQRTQAQDHAQPRARAQVQALTQAQPTQQSQEPTRKFRDGKDILSELDMNNLPVAEARRLIKQHNRDFFRSMIWDPALQKDSVEAYRLAHDGEEPVKGGDGLVAGTGTGNTGIWTQTGNQTRDNERDSLETLVASNPPTPPEKDNKYTSFLPDKKEELRRRRESYSNAEEWSRSVRLAMARLEDKITTEAKSDPVRFMKARRESAQLRAWIAAQRRTSEARLSAIAMGRMHPESAFEHAFVAELLKENEVIKFKHSSNPMAEAQRLFDDADKRKKDSSGSSLLPHYVPFSRYPLLTPLEEIEAESKHEDRQGVLGGGSTSPSSETIHSDERGNIFSSMYVPPRFRKKKRRLSIFDEKKAARRAGVEVKEYKNQSESQVPNPTRGRAFNSYTFSTSTGISTSTGRSTATGSGKSLGEASTTGAQLDEIEMHEARCCGLLKPRKAFVDKIS